MDPVATATTAGPAEALTRRVPGTGEQLRGRAWRFEVAVEMVSLEEREEGTGNEITAQGRGSSSPKGAPKKKNKSANRFSSHPSHSNLLQLTHQLRVLTWL